MAQRLDRAIRQRVMLLAMGLTLVLSGAGRTQEVIQEAATQPDAGLYGNENTAGVYVRDSAVALEKMAHAKRMQDLKEWGTSADLYQEILQKYPDRVVASGVDADNRIVQYTSVTEAVRQALCQWPPEGLDVYRARYETTAANLLSGAGDSDLSKLHQVYSLYFVTDAGRRAGIRLMDDYFELGDYAAVAQIGRSLLQWHPNLIAQRPLVLYRVGIAEKLCNEMESAKSRLKELRARFATATGVVRGEQVILADSLEQELSSTSQVVRAAANDSWVTIGGDSSRGKISSATGRPGAKLYSVMLGQRTIADPALRQQEQMQRKAGASLGVMPVTDRGELFFQDNVHLYGISLDSGMPLPGWAATYPNGNGQYAISGNVFPMPEGEQLCVTLSDKYVVAVMGLPNAMDAGVNGNDSRLVCLDRESGAEIWTTSVRNLPEDQNALRDLQIGGSPLIVGDNVYIMGHGSKGQQFEDCYVLCFDLGNGHLRWASYLASAADNQIMLNAMNQIVVSNAVSHLAYASGRLYAVTNLGAAAALDAYSGTIIWLDIYREGSDQNQNQNVNGRFPGFRGGMGMQGMVSAVPPQIAPWTYNPAVVQDGKVFILPSDGKRLLVYDAGTGKEIKRLDLSVFKPTETDKNEASQDNPDTLLAVLGDNVILGGPRGVWKIPWKTYDYETQPSPEGFWASATFSPDEPGVRGHGFVTTDTVYLPTIQALVCIMLKSGSMAAKGGFFPENGWDPTEEGPGNVLVTQNQVIIAGDKRVDVYTDLDKAVARLDRGVADVPTDPEPRLLYAEIMMVAGQNKLAEQKLDEAMKLMGYPQAIAAGPMCGRAFSDAMTFAGKLTAHNDPREEVIGMYDRAAVLVQSPAQHVTYLAARARFHLQDNDVAAAEDCYQQILADAPMRTVPLPDPDSNFVSQACVVAEKMMARILTSNAGKAAYGKYEAAAAAQLAGAASDPQKLLLVAQGYPNSQVARQAMFSAADIFESTGNPRMASQVLRRTLNKYHEQESTGILEALARNYLKMPGTLDTAVTRMAMAAALKPSAMLQKPLQLPDGSVLHDITFRQAHEALRQYSAKISTDSLPELSLPTHDEVVEYAKLHNKRFPAPFRPELRISNIGALLTPLDGFERYDRVVTWTNGTGICIYPVGASTPTVVSPAITDNPRSIAWLAGNPMAWSDRSIHLINGQTGKPIWNVDLDTLGTVEVAIDDSSKDGPQAQRPLNPNLPPVQPFINNRRFIRRNGVVIGRMQVAPVAPVLPEVPAGGGIENIDQVRPVGDRIIVTTTTGRILGIDSSDGQVAWQTRVSSHGVDHLAANDDFTVLRVPDEDKVRLIVLNSFSGELVGQKIFWVNNDDSFPINLALSDDGMLAYTLPEQLCVQDLHEAGLGDQGMEPKARSAPSNANPALFQGCEDPTELLINQGRIFAAINQGRQVRVYDLETAEPIRHHDGANGDTDFMIGTGSLGASPLVLKTSGDYLFIRHQTGITISRLDQTTSPNSTEAIDHVTVIQWLFGKDFLILLQRRDVPGDTNTLDASVNLLGLSRAGTKDHPNRESGNELYNITIVNPAGTSAWQSVQGGIVYFTGDGVVHTLLGARGQTQ